jgi:arginine-glutamic acid dipeptide repeat-containing protein
VHASPSGAFGAHRPQSPSSNHPANLSRNSPLHLANQHGQSQAAMSAERERHLMRQQSPHMTPPPTSQASNSSLVPSPLSKL